MYESDLKHSDHTLEDKLYNLYGLNREKAIDLSFRPPYLELLEKFENPHLSLPPVIHVAGTNGKGSSIAMMRSILEEMGLRVHAYTSPHLHQFNERIVLAGAPIGDDALEALIDEALALNDGGEVTFFEVTTAMAFAAFSRAPADVVLLETGLGGRLDCTNVVVSPVATLITTISKDHMEYLGDSLTDIAGEKAGIMKTGVPAVIAPQTDEAINAQVLEVFERRSAEVGCDLFLHGRDWFVDEHSDGFKLTLGEDILDLPVPALLGAHQVRNAGGVIGVLYNLRDQFGWDVEAIARGLRSVRWGGRLERVEVGALSDLAGDDSEIWYDGGHNDSAGAALAVQARMWMEQDGKPLYLIVGMKADKAPDDFLVPLMPYCAGVSLVPLHGIGACLEEDGLRAVLEQFPDVGFSSHETVVDAVSALAKCHVENGKCVLICGSLYLASQIHV